mmetsp:Transcript_13018/g.49767  ORF Transcript_13018/g.49767 Transcript_13018/m.49767 type:complete len:504 (-) Transcript_13018:111-1622(-)
MRRGARRATGRRALAESARPTSGSSATFARRPRREPTASTPPAPKWSMRVVFQAAAVALALALAARGSPGVQGGSDWVSLLLKQAGAARAAALDVLPEPTATPTAAPPPRPDPVSDFSDSPGAPGGHDVLELGEGAFLHGSGPARMFIVPALLSPEEAAALADLGENDGAMDEIRESSIVGEGEEGEDAPQQWRVSKSRFLEPELERAHPVASRFIGRVHSLVGIPVAHGEQLQLTEYRHALRDRYIAHLDSALGMGRSATALLYLRTLRPGDGGSTVFVQTRLSASGAAAVAAARQRALEAAGEPSDAEYLAAHADRVRRAAGRRSQAPAPGSDDEAMAGLHLACASDTSTAWAERLAANGSAPADHGAREGAPLAVRPVAGLAVIWFNHDEQGRTDLRARHAACELEPGPDGPEPRIRKMVAQRWMTWMAQTRLAPQTSKAFYAPEPNILDSTLRDCGTPGKLKRAGIPVPPGTLPRFQLEDAWVLHSNITRKQHLVRRFQ